MFFTLIEQSTIVVNDAKLKKLADSGNKKAIRLSKFLDGNSGDFVASIQFINSLLLLSIGGCAIYMYLIPLVSYFTELNINIIAACLLSFVIISFITTLVYLIFGIFVPKGLAGKYSESISVALTPISIFVTYLSIPFVWIPRIISKIILKIFGIRPDENDDDVTEEEIRMMVDIGSESGAIDDDEKEMIHNIFEMDDKPVEDIMTHRTDAVILWINDGPDKWEEIINETNHTRYPVCGNAIDDIIGVLNSRDFYKFLLKDRNGNLRDILREPYFVPESIKADEMFSQMQDKNAHFAIVLDEYGGFRGIVTQEDLIEEIVGELYSEYDQPEEEQEIVKLPGEDDSWLIQGCAEIEDVEEELGIDIPDEEYNTFAGLILDELGTVPADGEMPELSFGSMKINVTKVADHRIEEAVVTLVEPDTENSSESDEINEPSDDKNHDDN